MKMNRLGNARNEEFYGRTAHYLSVLSRTEFYSQYKQTDLTFINGRNKDSLTIATVVATQTNPKCRLFLWSIALGI